MTQPGGWQQQPPQGYPPQPPQGYPPQGSWVQNTQAGPAPGLIYGGFWIRFVAYLIDVIMFGVVAGILGSASPSLMYVVYLAALVYFPAMWVYRGQTVGMMPFKLFVVSNATGARLEWGQAILRVIGMIVSSIPFDLGFIWAAFDARKRGWHDMIGGSVVVRHIS